MFGLSLGFTSCKDDDKDSTPTAEELEKQAEQKQEQSTKFWNVVGQLVGSDQVTNDYLDKSFEATIGEPKNGNASVRSL